MRSPKPGSTEIARGDLPEFRGSWRLYEYRSPDDGGTYCLYLTKLAYDPNGMPNVGGGGGSCDYPMPLQATGEPVGESGIVWFGGADPRTTSMVGEIKSAGFQSAGQVIPLPKYGIVAWIILMPDIPGLHELAIKEKAGSELGRVRWPYEGSGAN